MRRSLHALSAVAVLILTASTAWANSPPVVGSVTAAQRPDKQVEIRYDLADADGDICTVGLYVSSDGGATWTVSTTAVAGAVGTGVTPGAGKLITWDSKVDLPGVVGSQFRVRICADDGYDRPPTVSSPLVTGIISVAELGTVQVSCTTTISGGTVQFVLADLSPIGGLSTQPLVQGPPGQWRASAAVTPLTTGQKMITFTAITIGGASGSAQAAIEVAPPGMAAIPAGEFQMGDPFTIEGDLNERPRHAVTVSKYFIDRREVTNQQYTDGLNWALAQGGLITVTSSVVYKHGSGTTYPYCNTSSSSPSSQITWNGSAFGVVTGKGNYPAVEVSWYGAAAYANWRSGMQGRPLGYNLATWASNWSSGYRLPTEAEWEKAARGGASGHRFPWSDVETIDFTRANYYSSASPYYDLITTRGYHPAFSSNGYPYTNPVGYFAANGYGLHDMAGNVWEWCNDRYDSLYYATSPSTDPRGPAIGTNFILRGGSYGSVALNLRCAYRSNSLPSYRGMLNGFRIALGAD